MWSRKRTGLSLSVAAGAALCLWACHLTADETVFMNVRADSSWTAFDSIQVILEKTDGTPLDTLFHGVLTSPDQLKKLPAQAYDGGQARVVLIGFQGGKPAKTETRHYDGRAQSETEPKTVVINPPDSKDTNSLDIRPDTLRLFTGGPAGALLPAGQAWAGKPLEWSTSDPKVATVAGGVVSPIAPGEAWIAALAANQAKDSARITVVADMPMIDAGRDTAVSLNATVAFSIKVTQEFGTIAAFKWSLDGDTAWDDSATGFPADKQIFTTTARKFTAAGSLTLRFYVRDGEGNPATATRPLTVSSQVPKITSLEKSAEIKVGDSVAFTGKAEINSGTLRKYAWNYGDGSPEAAGDLAGVSATIPGGHRFAKEGSFTVSLRVEDNLGVAVSAQVDVTVGKSQPPVITSFAPGDTGISIKDSLTFIAKAASQAPLKSFTWDFNGDGTVDETGILSGVAATITTGHRFPNAATFTVILKVADDQGGIATRQVAVNVATDPPVVDAGKDTTVAAGSRVNLHGKANDGLGRIAKMEWKIGTGDYAVVSQADTSFTAPAEGGVVMMCWFRATDDDQQARTDSVAVTISPSADANLASLALASGILSPSFEAGTTDYSASVANTVTSMTITPKTANAGATLKVNGTTAASGSAYGPINLAMGANVITLEVTAQNGTKKTYKITVTRLAPANADLKDLSVESATLVPSFSPTTTSYYVTMPNDQSIVKIKATSADGGASVYCLGDMAPGVAQSIFVYPGSTPLYITVRAADGTTQKAYTLTVYRTADAATRIGYAWVDDFSANHALGPTHTYNSAAGAIAFTRSALGKYKVTFSSLGGGGAMVGGNLQVTAYGDSASYCKINHWDGGGADFDAFVDCYNAAGAPHDDRFDLLVNWPRSAAMGISGYVRTDTPDKTSTPDPFHAFNAGDKPVISQWSNTGKYMLNFQGLDASNARPMNGLVTAYGAGNEWCNQSVIDGPFEGSNWRFSVNCYTPAGAPVNANFSALLNEPLMGSNPHVMAYAYVTHDIPIGTPQTISNRYTASGTGTPITVTHSGTGAYNVTFTGIGAINPARGGHVQVNAVETATRCKVAGWGGNPDLTANVRCHGVNGALTDSQFMIWALQ